MSRFFFSYRRSDAEADAGRIADRFRSEFGRDQVFFDTAAIDGGDLWRQRIDSALAKADVMLVVIGRSWIGVLDDDGKPRLSAANDVVAYEIGIALQRGIKIIPVRVQGAALPQAKALPATLAGLVDHNDFEVRSGPGFQ